MSRRLALKNAFLDAPFIEDGWRHALRVLADTTRSDRAQIVGIGDAVTLFNVMTDADAGYEQEFVEIGAYRPDVSWRVAATGQPLEVRCEYDYDIARPTLASDIYDDHCRKWGGPYGAQTALSRSGDEMIGLAIIRDENDGRTTARDRRAFAAGAAHALAAVRMQRAMAHRGTHLLTGTLESLELAAVFSTATVVSWRRRLKPMPSCRIAKAGRCVCANAA